MASTTKDRQRKGYQYPSPYMDIAGTWYPSSVKELFRWCKYYFYSNPIVGSIIYKLAEYPVTEFIYELEDEESDKGKDIGPASKKKVKSIIEMGLNLRAFLIEVGLDYFTYGNAFVSISTPFKRYLICPHCKKRESIESVDYQLKAFKFIFNCPKCKMSNVQAKVEDIPINDPSGINLVRWNPENIQIDYNDITGRSVYYYRIPNKLRNDIVRGKKVVIEDVPIKILEALAKRRDLKLDNTNLFHYKRSTLAEADMGWGKPIIMSIMKDIFYLQTLRKAQEAIAIQHIVPLDILFPSSNGSVDPYTHMDLSRWKGQVENELKKWRNDPNYISIMPVPVGISRVGGDGRMLLITPEIENSLKNIASGLGVPLEFLFGGLTWSGSSISLRTLENHFLTTRQLHSRFITWVVERLKTVLPLPKTLQVRMVEFKMADDVQQKQLYVNLNQTDKVSDETLLTEIGVDYDKEQVRLEQQAAKRNELMKKSTMAQAHSTGEAQKIQMNYQMDIQEEQKKKAEEDARKHGQSANMAGAQQMSAEAGVNPFEINQNTEPPIPGGEPGMPMEVDWGHEIAGYAQKANALPPEQKAAFLAKIKEDMPSVYNAIKEYMDTGAVSRGQNINMNPPPEQKPPRSEGAV